MISNIQGKILKVFNNTISIKTSSGVSFDLTVANPSDFKKDQEVEVETYMHWNQENGPSLFGFLTFKEKAIFEFILSCQGIGPKMAISIINQIQPDIFIGAIKENDTKTLSSINGIGPRKAEQIIMQLKNKVDQLETLGISASATLISKHFKDLTDVLSSLNYSKEEITCTLKHLSDNFKGQELNFDSILRKSLSFLSKK